jgi:hypothetical protein
MKFHITQETTMKSSSAPGAKEQKQHREVGFFQLQIPKNATKADRESIKELVLKNNTASEGDI